MTLQAPVAAFSFIDGIPHYFRPIFTATAFTAQAWAHDDDTHITPCCRPRIVQRIECWAGLMKLLIVKRPISPRSHASFLIGFSNIGAQFISTGSYQPARHVMGSKGFYYHWLRHMAGTASLERDVSRRRMVFSSLIIKIPAGRQRRFSRHDDDYGRADAGDRARKLGRFACCVRHERDGDFRATGKPHVEAPAPMPARRRLPLSTARDAAAAGHFLGTQRSVGGAPAAIITAGARHGACAAFSLCSR